MEKLLNKFQELHKEGKVSNGDLIAATAMATINGIKDALESDDLRIAKVLIAEFEKNLDWMLKSNE